MLDPELARLQCVSHLKVSRRSLLASLSRVQPCRHLLQSSFILLVRFHGH